MKLSFTKMQGAGNDFVVIDATRTPFSLTAGQIRFIADRRFGVGCDQMLVVESPRVAGTDFHYRVTATQGTNTVGHTPLMRDEVLAVSLVGNTLTLETRHAGTVDYAAVKAVN